MACGNDRVGLHEHVVFEHGVGQHAAGADRAARADARFSEKLHARLDARVRADDDVGIDQDRLRQFNRHARVHDGGALAAAEHGVHGGEIGARVATENFIRIRGEDGLHFLAFLPQHGDRVRQIQFLVHVLGLERREARP